MILGTWICGADPGACQLTQTGATIFGPCQWGPTMFLPYIAHRYTTNNRNKPMLVVELLHVAAALSRVAAAPSRAAAALSQAAVLSRCVDLEHYAGLSAGSAGLLIQ